MDKNNDLQELLPEEIKEIRKSLGLSQAEAGKQIGGGPRAFAKYENGSVKPSAALVKMLRFLKIKPQELQAISSGEEDAARGQRETPFEAKGEDISELNPTEFSQLIRKLLSVEAQEYELLPDEIHVSSKTSAPDGGEDARIKWLNGPERTCFLPNRFCVFQLKTGQIFPGQAEKEVLDSKNQIKPRIRKVLEEGGSYIILCSKSYTKKKIEEREDRIREKLRQHGILIDENRVQFRDSDQIASWINSHPSAALWLLRKTQPGLVSPFFGDWDHWFRREEHFNSQWVDDPRLPAFREKLRAVIETPKGVMRVVGSVGVGKSRLVLEALGSRQKGDAYGVKLSDLVLYAVESEIGSDEIKKYARNLANSGKRVVLVVDGCSEETRIDLTNIAKHSDSGLSLVTIESDTRSDMPESENMLFIKLAENTLIEKIIKSHAPYISARDRKRIADFSGGIISFARVTAKSWHKGGFMFSDEDEMLIRKYIGHDGRESDPAYEAAKLISVFGCVGTKTPHDELEEIARFGSHVLRQDFRIYINRLRNRGIVVLSREGFATLTPKHVAIKLAEIQWREWSQSQREEILVGYGLSDELHIRVADRLALLNTGTVARELVRHILGKKTLWFSPENLRRNMKLLYSFAQIDPQRVADLLEEILKTRPPAELQDETIGYDLVEILRKIAFPEETFENAATLLLRLARMGEESAGGLFVSLFPVRLANTKAGPEKRLPLIDKHINADDDTLLSVIVDALAEGTKTAFFSRTVAGEGPETHGSRPVLESWSPRGNEEWDYIKQCTKRLVKLAKRSDDIGEKARDVLGRNLYGYVVNGFLIEDVERWLAEVKEEHPYWPEALVALGDILKYYAGELSDSIELRVEKLMSDLEPRSLKDRIRFFLMDMPHGYFYRKTMDGETHLGIKMEKAKQLAEDLLNCEAELEMLIPELCAGEQSMMVRLLGLSLAKETRQPLRWKKRIMDAVEAVSDPDSQNHDLLVGYMEGIKGRDQKEFRKFKEHAKASPVFARTLPSLMFHTGIASEDMEMMVEALDTGLVTHEEISAWNYSSRLSELRPVDVIPLFDLMLKKGEMPFFEAGLRLMCAYLRGNDQLLEDLRGLFDLMLENGAMLFFDAWFELMCMCLRENDKLLDSLRPQLLLASEYPSVIRNEMSRESLHPQNSGSPVGNLTGKQAENTSTEIDDWGGVWKNIGGFCMERPASPTAGLEYATLMNWILLRGSEDPDARAVAVIVARQVVEEWDGLYYLGREIIKPVLPSLLSGFGEIVWPLITPAIEKSKERFLDMMGDRLSSIHRVPPVLNLPENTLFGWCHANPDVGPAFVVETVPLLILASKKQEEVTTSEEFHPLIMRLLDEFGNRRDVLDVLELRMNASEWTYHELPTRDRLASYRKALHAIENHNKGAVRRWVGKILRKLDD